MLTNNDNAVHLGPVDYSGEPICLFIDGQEGFSADYNPPTSYPTSMNIKVGEEIKVFPCAYAWKDVLAPGTYAKHATNQSLSLSEDDLKGMVATVKEYLKNGNSIPIPHTDHNETKNVGYVLDARINNGRLELYHQLIGEAAALHALQNKVSVLIHRKEVDPKNNKYNNCIVHSSLTSKPVVTGQRDWAPVAASRGEQQDASIYVFAASRSSDMTIAQLRALLGLGDNVSDADVLKAAGDKVTAFKGLETANATLTTEKTALSQTITQKEAKITELTTSLTAKSSEVVSLSQKVNKNKPTAMELHYAKEAIIAKRASVLASGAITAAIADKVEARYLGGVKLDTISLSRDITDADIALSAGLASTMDFYDSVQGNVPTPKGEEKTGAQADDKKKDDTLVGGAADDKTKEAQTTYKTSKDVVNKMIGNRYQGPTSNPVKRAAAATA